MSMPRSRLVQVLNAHKIHNDWELLSRFTEKGEINVAVTYRVPYPRLVRPRGTQVWAPGIVTDADAHWVDNGNKTFTGQKAESWPKAMAWATEKYKITKWGPSPFGASTYLPERVIARARSWAQAKVPLQCRQCGGTGCDCWRVDT